MKISTFTIIAFAFGIFLGVIVCKQFQCNKPVVIHAKNVHDTTFSIHYKHDTIPHIINTPHDDTCWLVASDSNILPSTLRECDNLLRSAVALREYKKSFSDSSAAITVETITHGTIDTEKISYRLLQPTKVITQTIMQSPALKNKLFISGFLSGNQHGLYSFGPELLLDTKTDKLFGVGYDLLNNALTIHLGIKIHF